MTCDNDNLHKTVSWIVFEYQKFKNVYLSFTYYVK